MIRQIHKSLMFLELVGEAGSGKTTLVGLLWKSVGRTDYEGFDPSKATAASRARNFSQVSNLPVVLIESEREQKEGQPVKHLDWDELKTAYNGRSVRSIGVKNNGNDTHEPPFRAALLIAQNNPVNASEPILQRIGHVHLAREHHTPETKQYAEQLELHADRQHQRLSGQGAATRSRNTKSGLPHVSDFVVRDRFFKAHLKAAGVRYRGPGQ